MQKHTVWRGARNLAAGLLLPLMFATSTLSAATHVVSPTELTQAAAASSASRQQNQETLSRFLSSEQARASFEKVGMDPARVAGAVAQLNDEELAKLAARADQVQADFAAGTLSNRDLLWVVVAIAALILIIVAVR